MLLRQRYRVLSRLGAGGMGTVYQVEDVLSGGRVALKAQFPGSAGPGLERALWATLREEFRVLALLRHPRLARVHDFGRLPRGAALEGVPAEVAARGGWFFTRDLVDGVDLDAAAAAGGRDLGLCCRLLADAAATLDVLHRAGLRHGDFKPQNAIVDAAGDVHLIDFGLAAGEGESTSAGTLAYLAPEVLARRPPDRRTDLYALGVTLYELATGVRPSGAARGQELYDWHRRGERPRLPGAPAALDSLIGRLWAADPEDRLPSAAEAHAALSEQAAQLGHAVPAVVAPFVIAPAPRAPLAAIERVVERRLLGEGPALVEVIGAPGAGKSAVLQEVAWRAQLAGAEVVRCAPAGVGRPFAAIAAALDQVAALAGRPSPLAGAEAGSRFALFERVGAFLADAARAFPIVLLVDDVDRCDEGTRALVRWLAHALPAGAPVLMVSSRAASDDGAGEDGPRVELAPLGTADVREMVRRAAGRDDDALAARIREHTGGNLLHVVETLRALAARGFPPADSLRALDLPGRLEELAVAELDAAPAARAACEALAALGRPAPPGTIDALAKPGPVQAALAAGLLAADAGGALWFVRSSTAAVAYRRMPPARRAKLHAACARLPLGVIEIARHHVLAGDVEHALVEGVAAAEELARAHDHAAALELGAAIVALCPPGRKGAAELRLRVAELARLAADAERVAALIAPLLADARTADRARVVLARAREDAGDPDGAAALYAEVRPASAESLVAARELARLYLKRGKAAEAAALVAATLARLPAGEPAHELRAAGAFARGMQGDDVPGALAALDEAAASARVASDRPAEATARNYAAILAFRRGDYGAARTGYQAALAALEHTGEIPRIANLRMNLASLLFHQGEYARCLELLTATVALLRAVGADAVRAWARRNLGHLYVELGAHEQARAELRAAGAMAERLGLARHRAAVHALLGIVAARSGDLVGGRVELARARILFEEAGDRRTAAEVGLDLAEVELLAGGVGGVAAAAALVGGDAPIGAADGGAPDGSAGRGGEARLRGAQSIDEAVDVRARRRALVAEVAARRRDAAAARAALPVLTASIEEIRAQGGRHLEWTLHLAAEAAARAAGDAATADGHRAAAVGILEAMALDLGPELRATFWNDPRRRTLRSRSTPPVAAPDASASFILGDPGGDRIYRVLDIYRRLNSELDPARLLELAMDAAVELTGAERGFLLLSAAASSELRVAVARDLAPAFLGAADDALAPTQALVAAAAAADGDATDPDARATPGREDARYSRSIAEQVYRSGEPVIAGSARGDERFADMGSVLALRLESVICIPVRVRGRIAGVLYLDNRYHSGRFTRADLRLLLAFGDQVAIALENARLLGENARRADELSRAAGQIEELYAERGRLLARRTEELAVARRDLEETRRRLARGTGAFGIVGKAPAMARVLELIERLGPTDVPVLIEGESGTGKELVARALHQAGPRRRAPLVSVNCGALPDALLESELFGHVRGAFTGADRDRRGLFQAADGGTLFLDEIGDTPARMQVDLLRALQEGTVRPVGASEDVRVDVRVVAAANRPLDELVTSGKFRKDLYYRLHVVAIPLPPLRDRLDDIPLLVDHFLDVVAVRMGRPKKGVTRAAMRRLLDHPWPGNVRQLEHVLMNACVLADAEILDAADLEAVLAPRAPASPVTDRRQRDKARILAALESCSWNKSKAASKLGMPRRTFYRRLADYGID